MGVAAGFIMSLRHIFKMADEVEDLFLKRFKVEFVEKMADMEELASDILSDRQQIVELDRKRNSNREALRALKHKNKGSKSWLCFGNTFIKLNDSSAQSMIEEDQRNVNEEMSSLRTQIKPKVAKLHQLEGLPEFKGFNLSAMGSGDMDFVAGVK